MKHIVALRLLVFCSCFLCCACNSTTPENYFDQAVLNCNMMSGFANIGLERQLAEPSVKLLEGTKDQTVRMKRSEVIEGDLQYLEEAFSKVKSLPPAEDSREIVNASMALYEYVLPVYKKEYRQLAKLYDDSAPADEITALAKQIRDNYGEGFRVRYDAVMTAGKPYAAKHKILVKWDVKTSPE